MQSARAKHSVRTRSRTRTLRQAAGCGIAGQETQRRPGEILSCSFAAILLGGSFASSARAAMIIFGGPTYDSTTQTGYLGARVPVAPGSTAGDGVAVGYAEKIVSGSYKGDRAWRWDASGAAVTELGNLGTGSTGFTYSQAYAVNTAGTTVGFATKYASGSFEGNRAVRWDASGTAATELGNLGTNSNGVTNSYAYAVNTAGTAVGNASKYASGSDKGTRAVRWDASGTAATELGNLGTDSGGFTAVDTNAVNTAGMAVGDAYKFDAGNNKGYRAVRWDASGTAATELGNLGTDSSGVTDSKAYAVNTAGTAVGEAQKYASGSDMGYRAVRWDASGTAAAELGNLGTDGSGKAYSGAFAINTAGTAVGYSVKFDAGSDKGNRAVRWDASGTAATELGILSTDSNGVTNTIVNAINTSGIAVGYAEDYDSNGTLFGYRAVAWGLDGVAINLNTLIEPGSGWVNLSEAEGISDTNWVTGIGGFDPDGAGGQPAYSRLFLMHLPESALTSPSWNVDLDGNWSTGGNWTGGTAPNSVGRVANFGTTISAPRTVTLDAPQTVGAINFTSPIAYTLAGTSTLTLDVASGLAQINVTAGSHTISVPIVLGDDTVVNVAAGESLSVRHLRGAGISVNSGTMKVIPGDTPNAVAGTSKVTSLSIASSGAMLDLTNNSFIVDYSGPAGTLINSTRLMLHDGKLTSSSADAAHVLGYGDNAALGVTTFAGQSVDASAILVKFTFGGDANLDGQVDVTDLGSLATNWQASSVWTGGDFNYDGMVDVTDLGILATNWQQGVGSPLGTSLESALAAVGLGGAAVPEPATFGLAGLAIAIAAVRRRRR